MRASIATLFAILLTVPATASMIEISIDVDRGVAYVPFGTVLPPGMTIHATGGAVTRAIPIDETGLAMWIREEARAVGLRERARLSPPLRIEFANESRFAALRAHFAGERADNGWSEPRTKSFNCSDIDYEATQGGYTAYFTTTFCSESGAYVGGSSTWFFGSRASVGGDSYAYVSDNNGNYNCSHTVVGYGSAYCNASAYTQLYNPPVCRNIVVTGGTVTFWVYLSEYEIEYNPVSAYIDFCTFFD